MPYITAQPWMDAWMIDFVIYLNGRMLLTHFWLEQNPITAGALTILVMLWAYKKSYNRAQPNH